jgi:non-ribosomal peptide synthetase component E (peptide arylation enzyme)
MKLDNRNLVSFVSPQSVCIDSARQAVESKLPYYCVPAMVIAMDEFPVTSRGKVDKRALMRLAEERQEMEKIHPELLEAVPC